MPAPHEVVASALTIYLADVGTAFPAVSGTPSVSWTKLGTAGANNYDEDGVTVAHSEEVNDWTPVGSTMPLKRFRTAESFMISLNLVDVSPEAYALVMNDATVTTAGSDKSFSLYRGDQVNSFAVLARGMSSVDNDLNCQYEFSKAFVSVNGDVVWKKGDPAMLPVEILAVRHDASDVIIYRVQTS